MKIRSFVSRLPLSPKSHFRTLTMSSAATFYDFVPQNAAEQDYPLSQLKNKVVLVVNTASKCGFTPQYKDLEAVWTEVKAEHPDFMILGFPCNQFGGQEPGSNEEIQDFCSLSQKVTFPVLAKVDVKGRDAAPLFKWLTAEKPGWLSWVTKGDIMWNFEKFLIGRDGQVKGRWRSVTNPRSIKSDILKELALEQEKKEQEQQEKA